ncbi:MAG TPA: SelB C-terminal domain-containing protein, partial [Candidatus Krumholzibacterium sp.]|nr:SelB C-terminal domain-containing protein [Candidatus Krumholzibacterium sp.]
GKSGALFFRDGKVRAGSGDLELSGEDRRAIDSLRRALKDAGLKFLSWRDLEAGGIRGPELKKYIHILQADGGVMKLGEDAYVDPGAVDDLKAGLAGMLSGGKDMTVGDFKERFALSRKYAVPLLEYLDREKITVRAGDSRRAGPALEDTGKEGGR